MPRVVWGRSPGKESLDLRRPPGWALQGPEEFFSSSVSKRNSMIQDISIPKGFFCFALFLFICLFFAFTEPF